jgi:hypothetical protein
MTGGTNLPAQLQQQPLPIPTALAAGAPGASNHQGREPSELASVSLASRIPEFWIDQPRLWYVQLDAILEPQRLGDLQKYNVVVTKLGKSTIQAAKDILLSPPETGKYEALRDRLLSVYEESEEIRQRRLLQELELGDQKPSQLMRQILDLAGGSFPDTTLRILWIGLMPPAVKAVLAGSELSDLKKLAALADKILEATRAGAGLAEVSSTPQVDTEDRVMGEIAKIGTRLARLEQGTAVGRQSVQSSPRTAGRPRAQLRQARSRQNPDWLCFYHHRYGEQASKCVKPCGWKAGN